MIQKILLSSLDLMQDTFGNYVIQNFIKFGSTRQKLLIFESIRGRIFELSCHKYSFRVIQQFIEVTLLALLFYPTLKSLKHDVYSQLQIIKELKADTFYLIENKNGNHVIRKCLEVYPPETLEFIIQAVLNNVSFLLSPLTIKIYSLRDCVLIFMDPRWYRQCYNT